jgi:myo-inositol-1(or 4)-monophosphatase
VEAAREAAQRAGAVIARYAGRGAQEHWEKAEDSPVTQADLEADAEICRTLRSAFPDDTILSEETVGECAREDAERLWIIDPLDGTKEFIEGVPQFAVSVALAIGGEPVVGCVYQPLTRECFWAERGGGAHLGAERLAVSEADGLSRCVLLSSRTEMKRGQLESCRDLFHTIEPIGSAAFKLALVACARGDLWLSMAPKNEWDVCAGDLLVREAGGVFVTLEAGPRTYNQPELLLQPPMLAGPARLVDEFRERSGAR